MHGPIRTNFSTSVTQTVVVACRFGAVFEIRLFDYLATHRESDTRMWKGGLIVATAGLVVFSGSAIFHDGLSSSMASQVTFWVFAAP